MAINKTIGISGSPDLLPPAAGLDVTNILFYDINHRPVPGFKSPDNRTQQYYPS
ncbi:MAG: hypothetical protein ABWZ25_01300 [Chitinophagaceae bacterium]